VLKYELCSDGSNAHDGTCLETRSKHEGFGIVIITDRNENVPLESQASDRRTQEKVRDPNPWSNDRTFPLVFYVTARDTVSISIEIVEMNAHRKS
jgi:hypothetical protein